MLQEYFYQKVSRLRQREAVVFHLEGLSSLSDCSWPDRTYECPSP